MGRVFTSYAVLTTPKYVGPGDTVPGATGFWGLRSYNNASIGKPAIRLRRDSDNTVLDFYTVENGGLDLNRIASFEGAGNVFVDTLYDQVGTVHLQQATLSKQPQLVLGGFGSLPVMHFNIASVTALFGTLSVTVPQPWSITVQAKRTASTSTWHSLLTFNAGPGFYAAPVPDRFNMQHGATDGISNVAFENTMNACVGVANGTSSNSYINGTFLQTLGSATNATGTSVQVGDDGTADTFEGDWCEGGLWALDMTGSEPDMVANMRSFWRF